MWSSRLQRSGACSSPPALTATGRWRCTPARVTRLSAVIGERDPSLLSSVMRSRGTRAFYQVRIGADTRSEADDLCSRIRKAGGACFVLKNRGVSG